MILDRVTITGADDETDPMTMALTSEKFPFVEWGILFGSRFGGPRFPSLEWVERLLEVAERRPEMHLSAHLCGSWVRNVVAGGSLAKVSAPVKRFGRVQLNFHAIAHTVDPVNLGALIHDDQRHWILQMDGVNDDVFWRVHEVTPGRVLPLFDRSGGAGRVPAAWPKAFPGVYCGYAGGLGPENFVAEVERIGAQVPTGAPIWVDMERRVRSENDRTLQLDLVWRVLAEAARIRETGPA